MVDRFDGNHFRALPHCRHWGLVRGITATGKTDRGGAQIHAQLSAINFARAHGLPYHHMPLVKSQQQGQKMSAAERAAWDENFNLTATAEPWPSKLPIVSAGELIAGEVTSDCILASANYHRFCDADPDSYLKIRTQVRDVNRLPQRRYPKPTIAVHVRRGDVSQDTEPRRFTSNDSVAKSIAQAKELLPDASVRVFSEGREEDFAGLPVGCEYELNSDVFETVAGLAAADCLVMAKSSFSYVAALLNGGTVYYQPFRHKPLSEWRILDVSTKPDGE